MTTAEAAEIIGCGDRHVRNLIVQGVLRAILTDGPLPYYRVNAADVRRYAEKPQKTGYPRGKKRLKKRKS